MPTFTTEGLAAALDGTFNGSITSDLTCYIASLKHKQRWVITSDYCLGNKRKFNDCFAYTAFPGGPDFDKLKSSIVAALAKDWKDVSKLDASAVQYLRDGGHFQFNFIVDRKRPLFGANGDEELAVLRADFEHIVSMIDSWPNLDQHSNLYKRFKELKQKVQAKNFNLKHFKNVYLASLFAAYVSWVFVKGAGARTVGWFSDRDSITTSYDGLSYYFYHVILAWLCLPDSLSEPEVMTPSTASPKGGIWYDPYIRIPDYFAGGYSSWNLQTNKI